MYIDLRPPQVNRRLERRRLLRLCGWTWSAAALIGLIALGVQYRSLHQKATFASARSANAGILRTVERRIETLQSELASDEVRLVKLQQLIPNDRSLAAIAVLAESVRESGGRVVVTGFDFTDKLSPQAAAAGSATAGATPEGQSSLITIAAVATDDAAISEFVQTMECQGFFASLRLNAAQTLPLPGGAAKEFDVECEW